MIEKPPIKIANSGMVDPVALPTLEVILADLSIHPRIISWMVQLTVNRNVMGSSSESHESDTWGVETTKHEHQMAGKIHVNGRGNLRIYRIWIYYMFICFFIFDANTCKCKCIKVAVHDAFVVSLWIGMWFFGPGLTAMLGWIHIEAGNAVDLFLCKMMFLI